jgi:uroporphyrinogen III methyltransferase / synthase
VTPTFLVVRSGERPFPAPPAGGLQVVERVSHAIEDVPADSDRSSGEFDLAILASRTAVERLFGRADLADLVARLPKRILAIGPATAASLRTRVRTGGTVEEGGGSAARLLERLPFEMRGSRVLLPRGEDSSEELPRALAARGAEVVLLTIYRKIALPYDRRLDPEIVAGRFAAFCATSPSAARWLFGSAAPDAREYLRGTPAVVLGEPTESELARHGVRRIEIADPPTFESAARLAASLAARTGGA